MPESGMCRVILAKVGKESPAQPRRQKSARDGEVAQAAYPQLACKEVIPKGNIFLV
jgi:hypothetical protein